MTRWRSRVLSPRTLDEVDYYPDGEVLAENGQILSVGPYQGGPVDHHLPDCVLVPGFVDAHLHFPQTRIVGAASGPLLDWLNRSTFPEEARFADPDHAAAVAGRFVQACLGAGTTFALAYGPVFPTALDPLFAEAERRGLRLRAGPVWMDAHAPAALTLDPLASADGVQALVERWHLRGRGRLQVAVLPRFALTSSAAGLRLAAEVADRHQLWVSTHLSENLDECELACERWGTEDYLSIYEDHGLVHARSIYAHCLHLSGREWDRFAAAGAVVAHCPDSNAFLGSGNFPLSAALDRGVPLSLGTDIAAGRSFRVSRTASYAYDNAARVGSTLTPANLLWWASRGGALALGEPTLGHLAPGAAADLAAYPLPPWAETAEDALATLFFDADAPGPRAVWVGGSAAFPSPASG